LAFGIRQPLDQLITRDVVEVVRRHALFILQAAATSKSDSIQDEAKRLLSEFLRSCVGRESEAAPLELLRKQRKARSIPREDLHVVASAIDEDEEITRVRILIFEDALHQDEKSTERFPHVCGFAVRVDVTFRFAKPHAYAFQRSVMPGYFQGMKIPLLAGRDFDGTDLADAPRVIILNQTAADTIFPGECGEGDPNLRQVEVCVIGAARCEACLKINAFDDLNLDCD